VRPAWMLPIRVPAVLALAILFLGGCAIRGKIHPMVEVRTRGGTELGVSTTDGVLFLGTTAREGRAQVLLFYGDIPYEETARIRPAGGGLFRLEMDVRHQGVPIAVTWPKPGEELLLMGMRNGKVWTAYTHLVREKGVFGEVYALPSGLRLDPTQAGAGIFRKGKAGGLSLLGLVKGTAVLRPSGRKWLCVAGLRDLKECMLTRRDVLPSRKIIHRPDLNRPIIERN